jgi:membrane protease YdiL (CAAX protease family)
MAPRFTPYGEAQAAQSWPKLWVVALLIIAYFLMQGIAFFALEADTFINAAQQADAAKRGVSLGARVSLDPLTIILSVLLSGVPMIALLLFLARRAPWWPQFGLENWSAVSLKQTMIVSIGAVIGVTIFNTIYGTLVIEALGKDFKFQTEITSLLNAIPKTGLNVFLLYLAVTVVAPAVEELLFRGFLQNALRKWFGPVASIAMAAMIFSAVHMQFYEFPVLMALGAAFGYVYHKTGSMRVTMLLHMVNNAATLALM